MGLGFALINFLPGHEYEAYNKLAKVPHILELYPLFGEYDIIAKIEAEDFENINDVVANKIKSIMGIDHTKMLTGKKL